MVKIPTDNKKPGKGGDRTGDFNERGITGNQDKRQKRPVTDTIPPPSESPDKGKK